MPATLDHFEIPVENLERVAQFLEAVFGWSAMPSQGRERYRRLVAGDPDTSPIRVGLFEAVGEVLEHAVPVVRIEGESLETTLGRVTAEGGRVKLPPRAFDRGRFARFSDPEGNEWGLWGD